MHAKLMSFIAGSYLKSGAILHFKNPLDINHLFTSKIKENLILAVIILCCEWKKNPTPDILRYHCIRRPIGAFYDTLFRATSTRPQNLLPHNLPPTTNTSTTQLLLTYQMTHLTAKILKPNTTFVISSLNWCEWCH